MTSLLLTDAEAKEEMDYTAEAPKYPWGTSLCLDDEVLAKLGMTTLPQVGTVMGLAATVKVVSVSENESVGNDSEKRIELQITDMELTQATQERSDLDRANMLYGDAE